MKAMKASEFYFTGAAVLPGFAWIAFELSTAVLVAIALLLAGAVCAIGERDASKRDHPADRP
jgi:hypothetical protein